MSCLCDFFQPILLLQLQTCMAEGQSPQQNAFCVEKAYEKGPLHLLHSFRLSQLQNKINFFQGQVDPLLDQNLSLKDQLVNLTKLVISSTEILRHLLPSSDNPTKKLKLQMATIEEIATMIKEDWHRMQAKLEENTRRIHKLKGQKEAWKERYEQQRDEHLIQTRQLQEILQEKRVVFEARIASLQQELLELASSHENQKKQIRDDFAQRIRSYQAGQREFQLYKRQARSREEEFQKSICRLKSQIDANLISFEQAKKNIKMIYEKLMGDKLSEQAQNFELLLKMKQEEKMSILMAMTEAQEDFKRRAAQKQYEITKLTQRNDRYREQVGVLKNDIWKRQLQLDKQFQQAKAREEVINGLKASKEEMEKRMKQMKSDYEEEKEDLKRIIKSKEIQLGLLMEQGSASLQKLLAEKEEVENKLAEQQKKLKQATISLKKNNDMWQKKIEKMKEQWKTQEDILKKQLMDEQKAGKSWSERLRQSQEEKAAIIHEHNEKLRRIEDIHKEQTYILQCKYQAKISEITEAQEEEMIRVKAKHQRQISDINLNANEQMRQAIASFNKRMGEQQQNFMQERNNYQQQLKTIEEEAKSMQKRLAEARQVIEAKQIQHREAMRQFAQAAERQKQKWAQEMDKQLRQFQSEMQKQEAKLISLQAQMQKQIKLLKEANAIQTIQDKFLTEISKLKEQFAEKIKRAQLQRKKQVQALNEVHQVHMEEIKEGYNKDLIKIAQKIQQKSTFINERLINGFTDSQLNGLSQEEKKEFIIRKVQEIKNSNSIKEKKIVELQYALDEAERNVQKRVKARKEQLQRQKNLLAKECTRKVETITSECNAKVAQIEKERIQHAQVMYEQFQVLRDQHRNQLNAINKKYHELQTLFEQRPSRMQDLTKIKELINMQTKMDIEIQSYQKKMETANEIVKYLNLELENYKDAYDIFGPNGENVVGGLVGVSVIKTSNKDNGGANPQADTQHILDVIKSHRHGSQAKLFNEDRKEKEPLPYRRWNDTASPAVKDIKIFQDDQSQNSQMVSRDLSQPKQSKERQKKYSYLIVDKNGSRRNRFKTERGEHVEHQSQIMMNAQNFIKLIKANNEDLPPVVKEMGEQRRRSYRKRKLHKRQPTIGYDQYF